MPAPATTLWWVARTPHRTLRPALAILGLILGLQIVLPVLDASVSDEEPIGKETTFALSDPPVTIGSLGRYRLRESSTDPAVGTLGLSDGAVLVDLEVRDADVPTQARRTRKLLDKLNGAVVGTEVDWRAGSFTGRAAPYASGTQDGRYVVVDLGDDRSLLVDVVGPPGSLGATMDDLETVISGMKVAS